MRTTVLGVLLLAWSALASAADAPPPPIPRAQMEAAMLIDGQVEVDAQGRVERYTLDKGEKVADKVRAFVDAHIRTWQFEPMLVEGRPAPMRNRMSLLLALTPREDGNYRIALRNASFYPLKKAGYTLEWADQTPPRYPTSAARYDMQAIVYLALRVGRDGRVQEVMAEQVNLKTMPPVTEIPRWREMFASNAVDQARAWTFTVPTAGEEADDEYWDLRVPVNYIMGDGDEYGVWVRYIPGPRQAIPWRAGDDPGSPEVLAAGGLYPLAPTADTLRLSPSPEADS